MLPVLKPLLSLTCVVLLLASVLFGMIAWMTPIREPGAIFAWTIRIGACVLAPASLFALLVIARIAQPVDYSRPEGPNTKYDDASWHYEGDYPETLPPENAATHIGMFLAWLIERGLICPIRQADSSDEVAMVRNRTMTGAEFLITECDGKLMGEDLSESGNAFAGAYYSERYMQDWGNVFVDDGETLYHVEDTWRNYDRLKPTLDTAFADWLDANSS